MTANPRASLAELAHAVGVGKTTLYRFCPKRELLVDKLLEHIVSQSETEVVPESWTGRIVNPKSGERSPCPRSDVSTVPT